MEVFEDLGNSQETFKLTDIIRTIFDSCDVEKMDLVQVSELINIIKPYFQEENWAALNELHRTLDPEGKNIFVNSDRFYEVMDQWTKKMELDSAQEEEMNIDDNDELPSSNSSTKSRYSHRQPEVDNTEVIKELNNQMQKIFNELGQTKQQLITNEEINEILHGEVLKLNQKLVAEQQIGENLSQNLQKSVQDKEKLKEGLIEAKTNIRELKKTVSRFQKDCLYHESKLNKIENEKATIGKKLEYVMQQKNDCSKQLDYLGTELEEKEDMLNEFHKLYNDLKHTFSDQQEFINMLKEENNVLACKNTTAQKFPNNMDLMLKDKNNIQYKDSSIDTEKTHSKNQTLHDEMSKLNESNENYEELAIKNDELSLKNEKLSENLHEAQDFEIMTIKKTLMETTKSNEDLAKIKENLEAIIKHKIDIIRELQDKNMQLEQTNKNQIEELNHTKKDLFIFEEKLNLIKVINEEKQILLHQLNEKNTIIEHFGDLQQKYTISELKLINLTEELANLQKLYLEVQTEDNSNKLQMSELINTNDEYCQLQSVAELEGKLINSDDKLKEKTKNQQLEILLESNKQLIIAEQNELQDHYEDKFNIASDSLSLVNCCTDFHFTKELCSQYKNILMLVGDVSSCLKDHQCNGNAETIMPAYDLLKEIKIQLKYLLQNPSQAHTDSRQKRLKWSSEKKVEEYIPKKPSKFCCCLKLGTITFFGMALALAVVLGFNCLCRVSVPQSITCPLDAMIEFDFIGNLPI